MKHIFLLLVLFSTQTNAEEYYWKYIGNFGPGNQKNIAVYDNDNFTLLSHHESATFFPELELIRNYELLKTNDAGVSFDTIFSIEQVYSRDGVEEIAFTYRFYYIKQISQNEIMFNLIKDDSYDTYFFDLLHTTNKGQNWDTLAKDCIQYYYKNNEHLACYMRPDLTNTYTHKNQTYWKECILLSNNTINTFDTLWLEPQKYLPTEKAYFPNIEYYNSDTLIISMIHTNWIDASFLLQSFDRGITWQVSQPMSEYHNIAYNFYDSQLAFGFCQIGIRDTTTPIDARFPPVIYRTTDGGENWEKVFQGSGYDHVALMTNRYIDRNNVIGSNERDVFRTTNMGETWVKDSVENRKFEFATQILSIDTGVDGSAYLRDSAGDIYKQEKMPISSINFDLKPEERFSYLVESKFIIPNFVSSISDFSLFTLSGSEVNANFDNSSGTLDLSNLPSGVYVFRLHYTNESKSYILNKK